MILSPQLGVLYNNVFYYCRHYKQVLYFEVESLSVGSQSVKKQRKLTETVTDVQLKFHRKSKVKKKLYVEACQQPTSSDLTERRVPFANDIVPFAKDVRRRVQFTT